MSTADAVQAAAILALLILLEGVRRLEPDAVVLCRTLGARWRVATPARIGRGFHVVSWLVSFDLPIVLRSASSVDGEDSVVASTLDAMRVRAERARALTQTLQVTGTFLAALLVIGVPYAAWRAGGFGFLAGMTLLLFSCLVHATLARLALARAGAERPTFFRWISPFSATRAASEVQEQVVAGVSRAVVMRELLGDEALLEAYRPALYDLVHGAKQEGAEEVAALVGMARVRDFIQAPPPTSGDDAMCARCAARYRHGVAECSACGIALGSVTSS